MASRRTRLVSDTYGDTSLRLSLGAPHYGSTTEALRHSHEIGTGVFARALWVGTKHVVLLTYSQWVRRDGTCTGDTYRLCDADDLHMIERRFGPDAYEQAADTLRIPVVEVAS